MYKRIKILQKLTYPSAMHDLFCPFSSTSRHGPLISQKNFAMWNDRNYTSFTHLLIPATRWKWNSSKLQNCTTLPIFSRRSRDATTDIYVFDILNSLFIYLSTIYINRILLFLFIYIFINLFIVVRHPPSAVRRSPSTVRIPLPFRYFTDTRS